MYLCAIHIWGENKFIHLIGVHITSMEAWQVSQVVHICFGLGEQSSTRTRYRWELEKLQKKIFEESEMPHR